MDFNAHKVVKDLREVDDAMLAELYRITHRRTV